MDVPSEEEGGISAKRECANKRFPVGSEPEFDQGELLDESAKHLIVQIPGWRTHQLENECQSKCLLLGNLREDCERCISNQTSGDAAEGVVIDTESQARRNCYGCPVSVTFTQDAEDITYVE